MYTVIVEFCALVLWVGGFWHASRYQGLGFARPWFVAGYLAAFIRETLNQVLFQINWYSPEILRLGSAPVLVTLLSPGVSYLAFVFAKRFVDPAKTALFAGLIFLITASIALPIEATATQLWWWIYPDVTVKMFGQVPVAMPFVWGAGAAIFFALYWRIAQTRLPDQGRLYAMVALAPLVAVGQLLLMILLSA